MHDTDAAAHANAEDPAERRIAKELIAFVYPLRTAEMRWAEAALSATPGFWEDGVL